MTRLLKQYLTWRLRNAESATQDKYFCQQFARIIDEMESVRIASQDPTRPGREPRYRKTIDKLVRAFAHFAVAPNTEATTEELKDYLNITPNK